MTTLNLDAARPGQRYERFWNVCVGAGRANEGLRASWLEHLQIAVAACGFRYVRFHGLFHDDMFVYREEPDGTPVYNFQYVDDLFDRLLAAGIKPFVEFGFSPGTLARERGTVFWWKANGSPPTDYAKWAELVRRTTQHWVDRYGIAEVETWYFEIWNEPNLHPFFKGSRSEYFELYRVSVSAIKSVDTRLRVGGPATSNFVPDQRFAGEKEDFSQHELVLSTNDIDALDWQPVWLREFLAFCDREQLPVDFVSCHPYPTDWALDAKGETVKNTRAADATKKDLALLRRLVDAGPFPKAQIHLTEWSSSPSPRDHTHDHLQAATFIVKSNVESIGQVDSLSYWTFTDVFEENGAGDTSFHGGFGMITYQGIPKPSFHAYRLLNRLGNERLAQQDKLIATRDAESGKVSILAYHYPAEELRSAPASFGSRDVAERTLALGTPTSIDLTIRSLPPNAAFVIETLDGSHGNAIAAWHALGRPEPMTREQAQQVRDAGHAVGRAFVTADADGILRVTRTLDPWSVVLIAQV